MKLYLLLRKYLYLLVNAFSLGKQSPKVFVLCYHSIGEGGFRFSINDKEFRRQIEYLASRYTFIELKDLYDFLSGSKEFSKPSVLLTFDDGYKDNLSILDYLQKLDIKPVLFVLSNPEKADRYELDNELPLLNTGDIAKFAKAGWTIGSHGSVHKNFAHLSETELYEEVTLSKKLLKNSLGIEIDVFSYPKGIYSSNVIKAVEGAGYKLAFSMDDEVMHPSVNRFTIPRVGVDASHTFEEFKILHLSSSILLRKLLMPLIRIGGFV